MRLESARKVSVPVRGMDCIEARWYHDAAVLGFSPREGYGLHHSFQGGGNIRPIVSVPVRGMGCINGDGAVLLAANPFQSP